MKHYIGYEVRAYDGDKRVPDDQAELFCIYGRVGIFNWEWIEDVPDRKYGEQRINELKRGQP